MRLSLPSAVVVIVLFGQMWAMLAQEAQAADALTPGYLRCEYLIDPLGIDVGAPG